MSKSLFNDPNHCVEEYLAGLVASHSGLIQLPGYRIILRKDLHNLKGKVAILSGGGSGHEPSFSGNVGRGMLSGAICGSVFTSPPPSSIFAAIKAVNKYEPQGVLLHVANYTGDRINFGLAREWAKNEGIQVEMVVVGEDCAFTSVDRTAGRRGLAGMILVHKIGGALSEQGLSLQSIKNTLEKVATNMGTIGVCLRPCTLPGAEKPSFELKENEIALGLGVHGEAGVCKVEVRSCSATVKMMLDHMTDNKSVSHLSLSDKDEVALLINNLGGASVLEMGIVTYEAIRAVRAKGVKIQKVSTGAFVTSLQMMGISITVLKLNKTCSENFSLLSLLEMKADVANPLTSVSCGVDEPEPDLEEFKNMDIFSALKKGPKLTPVIVSILKDCIVSSCKALLAIKDKLNEFDRGSGDGDCGSTHARGAEKVLDAVEKMGDLSCPADVLQTIGLVCCETMGGASGAMYSIFMAAAARKLTSSETLTRKSFAEALDEGINAIEEYGGAKPGDRTMLDVLRPVSDKLNCSGNETSKTLYEEIVKVAKKAAQDTTHMEAKAGRASYVSQDQLTNPDPGAVAVTEIVSACANVFMKNYDA